MVPGEMIIDTMDLVFTLYSLDMSLKNKKESKKIDSHILFDMIVKECEFLNQRLLSSISRIFALEETNECREDSRSTEKSKTKFNNWPNMAVVVVKKNIMHTLKPSPGEWQEPGQGTFLPMTVQLHPSQQSTSPQV